MAPKKPTALEQPPRADSSSSEYEEEVSNEEEEEEEVVSEESEEEEEPKKTDLKSDSSSSSEEEDGSDEEGLALAPVKPVEVQSPKMGAKRKQKQPDVAPATAPASTVSKKRPVESKSKADGKESKKLRKVEDKRVAEEEEVVLKKVGEDTKKQLFERLFSEQDEIEMLNALLNYSAKKCIDPIEDVKDFHDFVKNSIHVDVSNAQLADKIRRMRKKYEKNASKTKEGGAKTFGKLHDQLCYNLSKNIWGNAASASGGSELKAKGKRTLKPNMTSDQKNKHASSSLQKEEPVRENSSSLFCLSELAKTKDVGGTMGLSDDLLKKGFELLNDEARAALEEKWKNMATAELELYHNRLELSGEHVKLSLDALKASGHRG